MSIRNVHRCLILRYEWHELRDPTTLPHAHDAASPMSHEHMIVNALRSHGRSGEVSFNVQNSPIA